MSVTAHGAKVKAADIFYLISHTNFICQVWGKVWKWNLIFLYTTVNTKEININR